MRWQKARLRLGLRAISVRRSPGRPRRITAQQARVLVRHLMGGQDAGQPAAEARSTSEIADFILQRFRISYHPDHVGRLMHGLGWAYKRRPPSGAGREVDQKQPVPHISRLEAGWVPGQSTLRSWAFREPH